MKNYIFVEIPYNEIDYGIIFKIIEGDFKGLVIHLGEMLMDNERLHYLWKIIDIDGNDELKNAPYNKESIQIIVDNVMIDVIELLATEKE